MVVPLLKGPRGGNGLAAHSVIFLHILKAGLEVVNVLAGRIVGVQKLTHSLIKIFRLFLYLDR